MHNNFDLAVIGAGAAGMMCAGVAAQRGLRVVLIDHAERLAEKIRISGGGRCNFTNLQTSPGNITAKNLVIATGGLSIPKIGATDFGYRIARQFGLKIVEPRPALVPLTFDAQAWQPFVSLAGLSLEVKAQAGDKTASY